MLINFVLNVSFLTFKLVVYITVHSGLQACDSVNNANDISHSLEYSNMLQFVSSPLCLFTGGPLYNGPGSFPPNAGFVGRPGSSGPPYAPGPPQGGPGHPGHFPSPGQPFVGGPPGFGMPPGSPFGHPSGHPMSHGPPVHGMLPGQMGGGPVDRIDQG